MSGRAEVRNALYSLFAALAMGAAHAGSAGTPDVANVPSIQSVRAIHYAAITDRLLARPISPREIYQQSAQTPQTSTKAEEIARLVAALANLALEEKTVYTQESSTHSVPPACQFAPPLSRTLALEQENGVWLFVTESCMEEVLMAENCRAQGIAIEACLRDGITRRFITYRLADSAWEDFRAQMPAGFFADAGAAASQR